jgi:hypothetical protein
MDAITVNGGLFMRADFRAEGAVRLLHAHIERALECDGGKFRNPPRPHIAASGRALYADGVVVNGDVFLGRGFSAEGSVSLTGAQVEGSIFCDGGTFDNPPLEGNYGGGTALNADHASVKQSVFLRAGFSAAGEVRLLNAQIGRNLECPGATFRNPPRKNVAHSGYALSGDGMTVAGAVLLREGFSVEGLVRLIGARIGGNLECMGATLRNPPSHIAPGGYVSLGADAVTVGGSVMLRDGFNAEGNVRLVSAQINGDLDCSGGSFAKVNIHTAVIKGNFFWRHIHAPDNSKLDLTNATVGALGDEEASWPGRGNLLLDGFIYQRISEGPRESENRLRWLELQQEFKPQPYRQLAKALKDAGDERGARSVLIKLDDLLWKQERSHFRRWILKSTVSFGYEPLRTGYWLSGLTGLGWLIYWRARRVGAITPKEEKAYETFKRTGRVPENYPPLHPLVYSLENSIPLLNLGQVDRWQPHASPRRPEPSNASSFPMMIRRVLPAQFLSWLSGKVWQLESERFLIWHWIQIVLGWILAALFIAGITGIIRRE